MAEKKVFDNTTCIEVDHGVLETWEVFMLEDTDSTMVDLGMVLAKYLANGSGLISPGLPTEPIDELDKEDRLEIKQSKAFKELRRFSLAKLRDTATAFATEAKEQLSPN